ncbi:HD domain-containing protein [Candidatus Parcubacteria bacterium]|nr:HD domain-containing protein [Candidatus Parcubacteria bacterium]
MKKTPKNKEKISTKKASATKSTSDVLPVVFKFEIPKEIRKVTEALEKAGFEAYLVGGCVRDLILGKTPKDWDVTTNAIPEQIIALFPKTFYENTYGTVGIVNEDTIDETLKVVEVTPYRFEANYSDNRHPDSVTFSKNLKDDLQRRDFTINAIALDSKGKVVDLYDGLKDILARTIRTVGAPEERFGEDGLRIMRVVRFYAELGFKIESSTEEAIKKMANILNKIAKERIRDEFVKIILSDTPALGIEMAQKLGILKYIVPELEQALGIGQNQAHSFDVWTHLMKTLQHSADKKWPLHIRLSALFHDIGKPKTRRRDAVKNDWTFYGHEVVGARMTEKIMRDLRFPKDLSETVTKLVRWHMFFSDTEQITLSAVRRLISRVGKENVWDLMNLRVCDRIGTGRPKENPYRLRKYKSMVEEVMRDPVSVGMLAIDGKGIMASAKIPAGPKIGHILHALLEEVLEDPKLNTLDYLSKKASELAKLSETELRKIGDEGKEKKEIEDEKELKEIRDKYHVK